MMLTKDKRGFGVAGFLVILVVISFLGSISSQDSDSEKNPFKDAVLVKSGNVSNGKLIESSENEIYKINLNGPSRVSVDLNHKCLEYDMYGLEIGILDSSKEELDTEQGKCGYEGNLSLSKGGKYYIILKHSGADLEYSLSLKTTCLENSLSDNGDKKCINGTWQKISWEHNGKDVNKPIIVNSSNRTFNGRLTMNGEKRFYKINITEPTRFFIDLDHSCQEYDMYSLELALWRGSEEEIDTVQGKCGYEGNLSLSVEDDYYIVLKHEGRDLNYSLNINSVLLENGVGEKNGGGTEKEESKDLFEKLISAIIDFIKSFVEEEISEQNISEDSSINTNAQDDKSDKEGSKYSKDRRSSVETISINGRNMNLNQFINSLEITSYIAEYKQKTPSIDGTSKIFFDYNSPKKTEKDNIKLKSVSNMEGIESETVLVGTTNLNGSIKKVSRSKVCTSPPGMCLDTNKLANKMIGSGFVNNKEKLRNSRKKLLGREKIMGINAVCARMTYNTKIKGSKKEVTRKTCFHPKYSIMLKSKGEDMEMTITSLKMGEVSDSEFVIEKN